jgi:hypothetical protein
LRKRFEEDKGEKRQGKQINRVREREREREKERKQAGTGFEREKFVQNIDEQNTKMFKSKSFNVNNLKIL